MVAECETSRWCLARGSPRGGGRCAVLRSQGPGGQQRTGGRGSNKAAQSLECVPVLTTPPHARMCRHTHTDTHVRAHIHRHASRGCPAGSELSASGALLDEGTETQRHKVTARRHPELVSLTLQATFPRFISPGALFPHYSECVHG